MSAMQYIPVPAALQGKNWRGAHPVYCPRVLTKMPLAELCCPSVFLLLLPFRSKGGDHRLGAQSFSLNVVLFGRCMCVTCLVPAWYLPGTCRSMDCCTIAREARYRCTSAVIGDTWAWAPSLCAKYLHPVYTEGIGQDAWGCHVQHTGA
jgi:hypothetical protein